MTYALSPRQLADIAAFNELQSLPAPRILACYAEGTEVVLAFEAPCDELQLPNVFTTLTLRLDCGPTPETFHHKPIPQRRPAP